MRKFFGVIATAIGVILCAAQIHAAPLERGFALAPPASASPAEKDAAYRQARERVLEAAKKYENTPYRYGGIDRRGLDCSGLVYLSFRDALGVSVPRNAESLHAWAETIQAEAAQPGDLLFFRTTGGGKISHVGIFAGGRRFIHSASEGPTTGVIYSSLDERYWSRAYASAGRVFPAVGSYGNAGERGIGAGDERRPSAGSPGKTAAVSPPAQHQRKGSNILIGFAAAPTWNTYPADGNVIRGAAGQVRLGVAVEPLGQPMIFGLELRPEWDGALGVFRVPLTFSWGLSDKVRIFAGPALSFGDAALKVSGGHRRYIGGTSWLGAAGITVAPFALKIGRTESSLYGELAWQSYFSDNSERNAGADLAAGIRISTGLRTTWRAR
ncbi:MAG: C40 family peptidase [Treponema sp.]|jgi:probable lipoprotein NlpC|nr:C40 family peptidase [Treponema sp.]